MRAPEENDIYNLFQARLNNPDRNKFSDDSWDKMEQLLDKQPARKKAVIWLYRVSTSIAATLLLFTIFYFLRPVTPAIKKIAKSSGSHTVKPAQDGKTNGRRKLPAVVQQNKELRQALFTLQNKHLPQKHEHDLILTQPKAVALSVSSSDSGKQAGLDLAASDSKRIFADSISSLLAGTLPATDRTTGINPIIRNEKITRIDHGFSHRLILSVLAAPDINSVNRINSGGQVGSNFGLQFSMQLSKRISISSGAFYAAKPYQTSTANYKPQTVNWWASRFGSTGRPDQVTADCKVLDIPLNVNYLLFNKGANKLSFGTGLSSYFMLSEAYHFNFADPSVHSSDFRINNRNQHFFGLVNLNATYERKVNNRFGIMVQPYLKLPITQIGFGQVDLRSTGVAAGFSWNINSANTK
jgi:hypothetical protein